MRELSKALSYSFTTKHKYLHLRFLYRNISMKNYSQIEARLQQELIVLKNKKNKLSNIRLICFLIAVIFFIIYATKDHFLSLIIAFIAVFVLIILVVISSKISSEFDYTKQALMIISQLFINDRDDDYETDNVQFDNVYNKDLDILEGKSLFNRINKTQTRLGNNQLKTYLSNLLLSKDEIIKRQEAFKELSQKHEWIVKFLTFSKRLNMNQSALFKYENRVFKNQAIRFIPIIFASINIGVFIYLVVNGFPKKDVFYWLVSAIVFANIINFIFRNQLAKLSAYTNMKANELSNLNEIFHHIEEENFDTELNQTIKKAFVTDNQKASVLIKTISSSKETLDAANFPIVGFVLNNLFLWRLYYSIQFENEVQKTVNKIEPWLQQFASLEAFVSFAIFNDKFSDFSTPTISNEPYQLNLKKAYHPLLEESIAVKNNFETNRPNNIAIITGANMAGKSTFLRTVGTNLVLAMNGANVSAEEMIFYPMNLFTSIRTVDNLSSGDSYFKNEINKLKILIDRLEEKIPHYIILDEILKGTNSEDKLIGSQKFLVKLMNMPTQLVGFIATHDLELTKLENDFPAHIINYCFELKNIDNNYLSDYKLRKGTTKMMNAIFLMKQFRIID